ncbi:MAG: MarR family winged helix-turn-helix transcriptional regulator [Chitinophagaceae bacterium]
MKYQLLANIVQQLEKCELELGEIQDEFVFAEWLLEQKKLYVKPLQQKALDDIILEETTESIISKYIIFLNRYAKMHLKKMLSNTAISNFDDFSFLIYLFPNHSFTKMELIEKNVMEKTSGMEVINRLLKNALLQQSNDAADKRSKRLMLTEKGREALVQSFQQMNALANIITGDLNAHQKQTLVHLLHHLHQFHLPIYLQKKG